MSISWPGPWGSGWPTSWIFPPTSTPWAIPPASPGPLPAALPNLVHYPDRRCLDLRQDLARSHDLSPEEILVGNGSAELIFLVARALNPTRALIVAPAFSEYQEALEASRVPFEFHLTPRRTASPWPSFPRPPAPAWSSWPTPPAPAAPY